MKIGLVDFVNATTETVGSQFGTGRTGNQCLSNLAVLEYGWRFDLVPFFLLEWIHDLLFASFTPLGQALIFSNCHVWKILRSEIC